MKIIQTFWSGGGESVRKIIWMALAGIQYDVMDIELSFIA